MSGNDRPSTGFATAYALIAATALSIFLIRVTAPAELADRYHQERQAAYVLDILQNGHWICQRDPFGEIASKPPMHAWVSAIFSLVFGGFSWFTLVLPGALAATGTALLLARTAQRYLTPQTGLLAALFFLVSSVGVRQIVQGRIDGLFAFTTVVTALVGFAAWHKGRGWTWFWLAATVATLAKGPLGVLLGGAGLLAVLWERRSGTPAPLQGRHWLGILLWFAISAGWLALAYKQWGQPALDKVVGRELVTHAVKGHEGTVALLKEFYMPTVNVLSRFAPWSLFTFWGLWRIWRQPSEQPWQRRLERFLFCWFLGGLAIFSIAAHQRPDLIYPLVPPAALIAADQFVRLLQRWPNIPIFRIAGIIALLGIALTAVQYQWLRRDHPSVKRTAAMRGLAEHVRAKVGKSFPLVHVDEPYAVQAYLDTMLPFVRPQRAAELLRGDTAVFVVTTNLPALQSGTNLLHVLYETPGPEKAFLVSNHPKLEWTSPLAFDCGVLAVELHRARIVKLQLDSLFLEGPPHATVAIVNRGSAPYSVAIRWSDEPPQITRLLHPGERWTLRRSRGKK